MSQPIQPDPIKPPSPNELNNLFDTLLDENIHIDGYIRNPHTSAWNQRDILNKIITVNESAHRLKEIAEWENDEAQTQYQQYGNLGQVFSFKKRFRVEFRNFRILEFSENLRNTFSINESNCADE
ncbi:6513_t:CDS:2 [Entrophospora sp. SA101]|nr:6513_t:CDS:2 [Entrophospora sp. SA101]